MTKKVRIKTLYKFLKELDKGAKNKRRTIARITNRRVRDLVQRGTNIAISTGKAIDNNVAGVASGAVAAAVGAAGGVALAGKIASNGVTALGAWIKPFGGGIGALLGIGIGFLVSKSVDSGNNKKHRLYQEFMAKQNNAIKKLRMEKEELEKSNEKLQRQIERYKYLIGVLEISDEIEEFCKA